MGQTVFAIGAPFGLDHSITAGILSGLDREVPSGITSRPIRMIQHDASLNGGNSGGALLDINGRLLGINTAIFSPTGGSVGIGFALPVDAVAASADQIIATGKVVRPVLGIALAPDAAAGVLGVRGVLVLDARPGGPAAAAGVKGNKRDTDGRLRLWRRHRRLQRRHSEERCGFVSRTGRGRGGGQGGPRARAGGGQRNGHSDAGVERVKDCVEMVVCGIAQQAGGKRSQEGER